MAGIAEKIQLPASRAPEVPDIPVGRKSRDLQFMARLFDGFANTTRLSLLLLLARRGEMCVGELVEEVGAPQPRVSDHLRCLDRCGFVRVRREGRKAYYSVADDRVYELLSLGASVLEDNRQTIAD